MAFGGDGLGGRACLARAAKGRDGATGANMIMGAGRTSRVGKASLITWPKPRAVS